MKAIVNTFGEYFIKLGIAVVITLFLIVIFYFLAKIIKNRLTLNYQKKENKYEVGKVDFMFSLIFLPMVFFAVYIGFQIVGIKSDIILGIVAIGLGVASEQVISDLFSSVFILSTPDLKIGKFIQIDLGGDKKVFGKIVSVNTRTTTLVLINKRKLILQNSFFIKNPIKSFNTDILRRQIIFYVHHDTNIEKLRKIVIEAINTFDEITDKDSTRLDLEGFTPNGLYVIAYFFTQRGKYKNLLLLYKKIKKLMLKRFMEEGIQFQKNNLVLSFDDEGKTLKDYKNVLNK